MTRAYERNKSNDIETAQESLPDGLSFSGTASARIGTGKKNPVQGIVENSQPDTEVRN